MGGILVVDCSRVSNHFAARFYPLAYLGGQILVFLNFGHLGDAMLAPPDHWFAALFRVFLGLSQFFTR